MDHDIFFKRENKTVIARIATDLHVKDSDGCYFHFTFECAGKSEAELLLRYLRERHDASIRAIRKTEFFSGWKHGKAKKHGKIWFDWFRGNLGPEETWK